MIVIEKNDGKKIGYEVTGTKITFDDDLTINLAKREQDWPVHIDICYDEDGELCIGAAAGRTYATQIDIPKRTYIESEAAPMSTEPENGAPASVVRDPVPLDMETVTLTLWAIE